MRAVDLQLDLADPYQCQQSRILHGLRILTVAGFERELRELQRNVNRRREDLRR